MLSLIDSLNFCCKSNVGEGENSFRRTFSFVYDFHQQKKQQEVSFETLKNLVWDFLSIVSSVFVFLSFTSARFRQKTKSFSV